MPPPERGLRQELRRRRVPLAVAVVGCAVGLALGAATGASGWPVYLVVLLLGAAVVIAVDLR